jgi:hypothetical protein
MVARFIDTTMFFVTSENLSGLSAYAYAKGEKMTDRGILCESESHAQQLIALALPSLNATTLEINEGSCDPAESSV